MFPTLLVHLPLPPPSHTQGALEEVLVAEAGGATDLATFNAAYVGSLERAAVSSASTLRAAAPALTVIEPQGAMYLMVEVHPEHLEVSAHVRSRSTLIDHSRALPLRAA